MGKGRLDEAVSVQSIVQNSIGARWGGRGRDGYTDGAVGDTEELLRLLLLRNPHLLLEHIPPEKAPAFVFQTLQFDALCREMQVR